MADEKQLRREYSRLRSTAKKRLERLEKGGFATEFMRQWEFDIVPLKEISNMRELTHAIMAVNRFLENPYSKVSVQKEVQAKIIAKLDERAGNKISAENLSEFGNFMDWARHKYGAKAFDSERAYDFFNERYAGDDEISMRGLQIAYGRWKAENV